MIRYKRFCHLIYRFLFMFSLVSPAVFVKFHIFTCFVCLDLFDSLGHISRSFQIRFVHFNPDMDRMFHLSLSWCVLPVVIFYRVPDMFRLLRSSFAIQYVLSIAILIQICFVCCDLCSQSSYVLSIAILIQICFVCCYLLLQSRYVSSIAIFYHLLDWYDVFVVCSIDSQLFQ